MNEFCEFLAGLMIGFVITMVLWGWGLAPIQVRNIKKEAVKHGCAEYNSQSGEFQWIDTGIAPSLDPIPMEDK